VQQERRYENQSPLHFYRSRVVAVAAATSPVQEEKQYFRISDPLPQVAATISQEKQYLSPPLLLFDRERRQHL
jgi:hypothetical protein